ncbi:hypothetical protein LC605_24045 [Nostoc sp. CHAB 5836]|uniref:hypothetical protein n=1 Tax=Nostoc sp. CHAB 5836 TaxID=2780404 RepID=UPI001E49D1F7|nr:hypothetical protein [Nostoc sp. CHAB 5836]MCC5618100.1 hypothetical protein [Nostoc sp. CHAB 5836]
MQSTLFTELTVSEEANLSGGGTFSVVGNVTVSPVGGTGAATGGGTASGAGALTVATTGGTVVFVF